LTEILSLVKLKCEVVTTWVFDLHELKILRQHKKIITFLS